jgi:hypothetical protein
VVLKNVEEVQSNKNKPPKKRQLLNRRSEDARSEMEELKNGRNGGPGFAGLSFDIFQVQAEGVVWRGAAATFEDANKRIQELALASPADYIVWNRHTGHKHTVKSGGLPEVQEPNENIS